MKPTITPSNLHYRGAYRLTTPLGNSAGLTYAPSRGTWFTVASRQKKFRLYEFHLPDDPAMLPQPVPPSLPLDQAPRATLVNDYGTLLCELVDPAQNDCTNVYWDEEQQRLFVSFGDFYATPATNDCVLAVDVSCDPPSLAGPWRFGLDGQEYAQHWGYSQVAPAPRALQRFGVHYLATGKDNNTFQNGSWGPGLLGVTELDLSYPPGDLQEARQIMFWPSVKRPVTLDTGKVKSGFLTSAMQRPQPYWIIGGAKSQTLGGAPEWSDVPYGVACLEDGWANGDDAGYVVAIEERDVAGVLFFGNTTLGATWYGSPIEFADDYHPDAKSPTGFRSWSGIDHPKSDRYFTSPLFPATTANPKAYVFDRQGGGKGNRNELVAHAVWIYSLCDLQLALLGAYEPREGLTSLQVDPTAFHVLATPVRVPGVDPVVPDLQYEFRTNPSAHTETSYIPKITGVHYTPGDAAASRPGRLYLRCASYLGVETDAVNVFDLHA